MSDSIDRQAAIDEIVNTVSRIGLHDNSEVARYGATFRQHEIIDIVKNLPAVQPDIIRCKDCKHLFDGEHNANCCELLMRKAKWLIEIAVDMNWYCADGERKEDETN